MSERGGNIDNLNTGEFDCKTQSSAEEQFYSMINCPTLISGLSHEMRTQMNSIVAFTFLLNNGNYNDEERKEFTGQIIGSCEHLMFMFDNFFDSVFIDTGNTATESSNCSLNGLLEDLMTEFGSLLRKEGKDEIALIHERQANYCDEVNIDTVKVIKVLQNLFRNSLSNTKTGYIKIGFSLLDEMVTFYVLDSGKGFGKNTDLMGEDNLGNAILRHNDTSSALNMAVSRKIVAALGGKIWVESNGISGSGIYFSLPVKKSNNVKIPIKKLHGTRIAI